MMFRKWCRTKNSLEAKSESSYVDLTPVDNADEDGTYSKALGYAFKEDRIKNIALTGPFGSGKSSIIKTFQKNNGYKFLNISLAAFNENDNSHTKDVENKALQIERSILQQMQMRAGCLIHGLNVSKCQQDQYLIHCCLFSLFSY